ncbi:ABC transporter ATP-binding protein [Streptobacillus moniliformis]|uniref:ATP-binding cassette domain-containing protein n=1 Tax=Streptobacillus moniliformis TaxID=34105 RepID=UPI0007E4C481|nr:ABC transporter ATP-binding protein [Streptobacillus moniliformis]
MSNNNIKYIFNILKKIGLKKSLIYFLTIILVFILIVFQPILISKSIQETSKYFIILLCISLLLEELLGFYNNYIIQKIRNYSKLIIWEHIEKKSYFEFINLNLGEIQNLIQEGSFLVRAIYDVILKIFKNFIMIVVYSILLFNFYKSIGIVYLFFYILYVYISYNFLKNNSENISKSIDTTSKINSFIVDYFINYNTIYSENSYEYEKIKIKDLFNKEEKKYYSIQFNILKSNLLLRLFLIMTSVLVIYIAFNKQVDLKILLIIIYSVFNLNDFGRYILNFFECWDRLGLVISKMKIFDSQYIEENLKMEYLDSENIIILKNISYKYKDSSEMIINNKSLEIKEGSKNLVIGKNGKGKSTLCKIIANMLNVSSGELIYNSKYIKNKNEIIYYSQNINLFDRSIIENILYPKNKLDKETEIKIKDIIKELELNNIIKNEDDLFNKTIGDFSKKISGGEKQKILIARALLSDKKVIIFDEINSGIDKFNNLNFYKLISKYLNDRTVIIISHREEHNEIIDNTINL